MITYAIFITLLCFYLAFKVDVLKRQNKLAPQLLEALTSSTNLVKQKTKELELAYSYIGVKEDIIQTLEANLFKIGKQLQHARDRVINYRKLKHNEGKTFEAELIFTRDTLTEMIDKIIADNKIPPINYGERIKNIV